MAYDPLVISTAFPRFIPTVSTQAVSLFAHALVVGAFFAVPSVIPRGADLKGDVSYVEFAAPVAKVKREHTVVRIADDTSGVAVKRTSAPQQMEPTPMEQDARTGSTSGSVTSGESELGVADGVEASARERYLYELSRMLNERKTYPYAARRLGETGRVTVRFNVQPDGTIESPWIKSPSHSDRLNRAALDLVESIKKFKPPPSTLATLEVPIDYILQ